MNLKTYLLSTIRILLVITLVGWFMKCYTSSAVAATQIDIHGPSGSGQFGYSITVLPNGNIVVTDPWFDGGIGEKAGAVYLYDGASGALISQLTGMTENDQIGYGGVTVLSNGNYVVGSPSWNNGLGAATWGSGINGIAGTVSAANSLVGSTVGDQVGKFVEILSNGNYVVISPSWDNGAVVDAGAVTWGSGINGVAGTVSAANSLVGSTTRDQVGYRGDANDIAVLSNGNYVVISHSWDDGAVVDSGAVTWGNGTSGVTGTVSAANSLVVGQCSDVVGFYVIPLSNGNYVVSNHTWDNGVVVDVGAVTWGNGTSGVTGTVSAANSLVGSTANDNVGYYVTPVSNGNYVVSSPSWDNGAAVDTGAVTWGNGTNDVSGTISATNSLVGSTAGDQVGYYDDQNYIAVLSNGNYVIISPSWDNGAVVDAGAVTWGSGTNGISGIASAANSLVGSTAFDQVGEKFMSAHVSNGNYVVISPSWDNGAVVDAGAVTWGNGTSGVSGTISATNSLVGSTAGDQVGYYDDQNYIAVLSNGNYVIISPSWDNGAVVDAGAVTWGSGTNEITGTVSATNSLVGSTAFDQVGKNAIAVLSNDNYVVISPSWDNGAVMDAGAVTWGSGTNGITGTVSVTNSLVGSMTNDQVGGHVTLGTNYYVVSSPTWDNGAAVDAGAATWGNGTSGVTGTVSAANSLVGSTAYDYMGGHVTPWSNGNYVVSSPSWDNGVVVDAGAVTWGSGINGITGTASAANSLVGSTANDLVGYYVAGLRNSNYVVISPLWDNDAVVDAGAVTWGNGASGVAGTVSAANSLVGSMAADSVGSNYITVLSNGNYLVPSPSWDNSAVVDAGALTWGNGASGVTGTVSSANSLVGSTAGDQVGYGHIVDLSNGNYYVHSPLWDNDAEVDAGAVTWGNGMGGTFGIITIDNSVCGAVSGSGLKMIYQFDAINYQLVVGNRRENIVTLFKIESDAFNKSSPSNGTTYPSVSPTLSWGTSTGTTSYDYCYDTTDNDACDTSWINNGTATSKDLSQLSAGTTYYWQVRAISGGGITYADNSTWWSFTTFEILMYLPITIK
jgi:hypothetical protein